MVIAIHKQRNETVVAVYELVPAFDSCRSMEEKFYYVAFRDSQKKTYWPRLRAFINRPGCAWAMNQLSLAFVATLGAIHKIFADWS